MGSLRDSKTMASELGNLQASIMWKKVMDDLPKIVKIFGVGTINKVMELVKTPVGGALLVVGVIVTVRYIVKYNTPRYVASASGGHCVVLIRGNDVVGAISNNPDEVMEVCSTVAGPFVVDGLNQVPDTFLTAYIADGHMRYTRNVNCYAVMGRRGVKYDYRVLIQTATYAFSRGDYVIMGSNSFWDSVDIEDVLALASNCRLERAARELMCLAIDPYHTQTFNSHTQQDLFLIAHGLDDEYEDYAIVVIYML